MADEVSSSPRMAPPERLFERHQRARTDDLHRRRRRLGRARAHHFLPARRPVRAGPEHIARLTIYVTDIQEYLSQRDELAPIWKSIMGSNYPAMALVEVKRLVEHAAKIEIEATAVVEE
jgi:hypothetical protein